MNKLLVSVVIPCRNDTEKIDKLLNDISCQKTSFNIEVIPIKNVSPAGKARNIGSKKAKGEILIFIDCDIRLGNEFVFNNLARPLLENKNIGIVSSSVRIPLSASKFQVCYSKVIPHCQTPIVATLTDMGVATSACCATSKDTFFKIGGFNEDIGRGQDPEFCFRLRQAGYRTVLAAHTWCYHPQPDTLIGLLKIQFRNGLAVAFVDTFYPELNIDVDPRGIMNTSKRISKFVRALRFFTVFLNGVIRMKVLLLLAKIIYLSGYLYGLLRYKILSFYRKGTYINQKLKAR
jgi:glycosyltransferase involved in cell wall biosynthesis